MRTATLFSTDETVVFHQFTADGKAIIEWADGILAVVPLTAIAFTIPSIELKTFTPVERTLVSIDQSLINISDEIKRR